MPSLIALIGGSGSGKSTLARAIAAQRPSAVISQDDYYLPRPPGPVEDHDFDHPSAIDWPALTSDVHTLVAGLPVDAPVYTFGGERGLTQRIEPAATVILEGHLIFAHEPLWSACDLRVMLDIPDDLALARRLKRDVEHRNCSASSVVDRWRRFVQPAKAAWIDAFEHACHIILPHDLPLDEMTGAVLHHLSAAPAKTTTVPESSR